MVTIITILAAFGAGLLLGLLIGDDRKRIAARNKQQAEYEAKMAEIFANLKATRESQEATLEALRRKGW